MVVRTLIVCIDLYRRLLSPFTPPSCRFEPSCSAYAQQALAEHGLGHGIWLAIRRLLRCHPWSAGGSDPVPHALPPQRTKTALPVNAPQKTG